MELRCRKWFRTEFDAELPQQGEQAMVTDATSATFGSVVAGGGNTETRVCFDRAAWLVG